jgi:hypothetical protein
MICSSSYSLQPRLTAMGTRFSDHVTFLSAEGGTNIVNQRRPLGQSVRLYNRKQLQFRTIALFNVI